jgi:hypothetical protein
MTELQLYEFCQDKEMHWSDEQLILFVKCFDISELLDLFEYSFFDERFDVTLIYEGIALDIVPICEYYGIEPTHILKKENKNGYLE